MNKTRTAAALLLMCVLAAGACARKAVVSGANVGPSLVVEQFLRAANAAASSNSKDDLDRMGRLFGTKDGPVTSKWPREEVENRMAAIARELSHQDFEVTGEQNVAGRTNEATRLMIKLVKSDRTYNVPFTLVRFGASGWLIEEVGLEVITNPRS